MKEHVDRYVEALLRNRRPKPFAPTQDEVKMMAAAIDLAAHALDDAEPRPAFVEQLRERLEREQQRAERIPPQRPAWRAPVRRRLLAAGALTVSGAAVGVAGAQLLGAGAATAPAAEPDEITPVHGAWQTVADSENLPEGAVLAFDLGPVTGFVQRTGGRVQAVSGICTHQGCRLESTGSGRLVCPCHGATFDLAGTNLTRPRLMNHPLPPLPRLPVREDGGQIQVYAAIATSRPHPHADSGADVEGA